MQTNFRNKYLVNTIRIIFGAFMAFSGISGLMSLGDGMKNIPPEMIPTMQMLVSTGIFYMIKITEIIAGLMLMFNFLPALAAIFLAPICIGVIVVNSQTAPSFIFMGVVISIFNAYLGYVYWDKYKTLFTK